MTPDDADLARLEHENLIVAIETAASLITDSLIDHSGGVALVLTGSPIRFFNQVVIEGGDASAAAISRAVSLARDRGQNFVVNLRTGLDDAFVPRVRELDLVPMSATQRMPGMAMFPIRDGAPPLPPGHEIVAVTDARLLDVHMRTAALGFEIPEELVRSFVSPAFLELPHVSLYTGYTNGKPVTTGVGIRSGRTIGVYNISTAPEARRNGYGERMTWRIVADGARAGCDVSVLQASDMGKSIYLRMGYRTVVEYTGYIDPG